MPSNLVYGKLIKRYKRFLVDVELDNQQIVTAHCTNSGSLKSCIVPGATVVLTPNNNPNRKTKFTWEMIKINDSWVGVNTNKANEIAYQILKQKLLKRFEHITEVQREVKFGNSRIDLLAIAENEKIFIEVKNVTYRYQDFALFPDAVTTRGQKHLNELIKAREQGYSAAMFFIVQRTDTKIFAPAWNIDPTYGQMLNQAYKAGVEIFPLQIAISPDGWKLVKIMDYRLTPFKIND